MLGAKECVDKLTVRPERDCSGAGNVRHVFLRAKTDLYFWGKARVITIKVLECKDTDMT